MNDEDYRARLQAVFAEVLDRSDFALDPKITMDDVESWDSFNHINLMLAIEAEFGVEFDSDQIGSLLSVGEIFTALQQRLSAAER